MKFVNRGMIPSDANKAFLQTKKPQRIAVFIFNLCALTNAGTSSIPLRLGILEYQLADILRFHK